MAATTKPAIQPRYITLDEWAEAMFSQKPHINTLRRWVHDGRIQPQPEKIGRLWRVKREAKYVND